MSDDNFTLKQKEMLLRAQKVVDDASENYTEILKQHIQELTTALGAEDLTDAEFICHRIQGQAGTFGWSLATEISGWFKRLLITQKEAGLNSLVNKLFLDSLDIMIKDELKTASDDAINLLIHIETELKKHNIP